ncbi:hypothetical protein J2T56_002686 [Natronobacillus azotifigens]|uniref:DUF1961 family protein n=1 Tax=Natronobacillus azotifigens TaxID=472978 RepID=A0A9J6RGR3_9BACI|nr:DUF1961 family protein [Natronobacillus azotifigens]MCZ0704337.1 DUF1961 family protein [Natronobacillus azotifigens]
MQHFHFKKGSLLYENHFKTMADLADFVAEGEVDYQITDEGLMLSAKKSSGVNGDFSHWLFWLNKDFPDRIMIEWSFTPIEEPGLCMLFFSATGERGEDLFSEHLKKRTGHYPQYHSSDIHTYHLSYFRRKWQDEREFCTCNLRKSTGFHLVAQGADPIPTVADAKEDYRLRLVKFDHYIQFSIDDLVVLEWEDDGYTYGSLLSAGKIGFRQMAPMKARYRRLQVYQAETY